MASRGDPDSPVGKCRYGLRQCTESALDGYHFCITHILEDKSAPYEQCCYISCKTGRRCALPARKSPKKDGLCAVHVAKINRSRCNISRKQLEAQTDSAESLLEDLEHYSSTLYNNTRTDGRYSSQTESAALLAELASSSDSDVEDRKWLHQSNYLPDSESESVDSEGEDVFKYAEVLTEEETTRITRDKLIRLQSLYIDQFKWLQYVLKERRRKYLHDRQNQLACGSTDEEDGNTDHDSSSQHVAVRNTDKTILGDDVLSKKYIALRRYHRKHGKEALMHMKSQERRKAIGDQGHTDSYVMNRYRHASRHGTKHCSAKNIKCSDRSLPFARYCYKHIELDGQQVLYRRCGRVLVEGGLACERMVVNLNEHSRCAYHTNNTDQTAAQSSTTEATDSSHETVNVDVVGENRQSCSTPPDHSGAVELASEIDGHESTLPTTIDVAVDPGLSESIFTDTDVMDQTASATC